MNTGGLWVGVSESHLFVFFVCIHSFMFSCHFCRAMSHRVKLVKVRCLFSKAGSGSGNCFDFWLKFRFLCVAGFECGGIPCPVFRLQRWDVLNTNLNSCCFCGSDDPTSSLTAQNISQLYSCRTFYMTMQPKVSHITKLIDDRKNNARLKITIKQYDVKDQ